MSYYFKLGQIPHKRHTQFRQPDGSLYHEELMGIRGFVGEQVAALSPAAADRGARIERGCEVKIPYAEPGPGSASAAAHRGRAARAATR